MRLGTRQLYALIGGPLLGYMSAAVVDLASSNGNTNTDIRFSGLVAGLGLALLVLALIRDDG